MGKEKVIEKWDSKYKEQTMERGTGEDLNVRGLGVRGYQNSLGIAFNALPQTGAPSYGEAIVWWNWQELNTLTRAILDTDEDRKNALRHARP